MDVVERKVVYIVCHFTAMNEERAKACGDLFEAGVDGDDAVELFEALQKEFKIDFSTIQWGRHFGPEASNPISWLLPSYKRFHRQRMPVGVTDLINAARAERWPMQYDEHSMDTQSASKSNGA